MPMPVIGTFVAVKDGYVGTIRTLTIATKVRLIANDRKEGQTGPDFRILGGPPEIGAAWRRNTKKAVSVLFRQFHGDEHAAGARNCQHLQRTLGSTNTQGPTSQHNANTVSLGNEPRSGFSIGKSRRLRHIPFYFSAGRRRIV